MLLDDTFDDIIDDTVDSAVGNSIGKAIEDTIVDAFVDAFNDPIDDAIEYVTEGVIDDAIDDSINDRIDNAIKIVSFFLLICWVIDLGQSCLFIYLLMNAVNFFFQNATSPTFMIGFFSYYTHIIPRWSCIWLVLGLAIWLFFGDLATDFVFSQKWLYI